MTILALALSFLAVALSWAAQIYMIIIFLGAMFSFMPVDQSHPVVRFVRKSTEPLLAPLRPKLTIMEGRLDLSPLVLVFGVVLVQRWLVPKLAAYAVLFQG